MCFAIQTIAITFEVMYAKAIALFAVVALAAPAPEPTPAPDAELLNRMVERQLGGGIPGIAGASLIGNQ